MKMSFGKLFLCVVLVLIGVGIGLFNAKFSREGQKLLSVASGSSSTAYLKVNAPSDLKGQATGDTITRLQNDYVVFISGERVLQMALREVAKTSWYVETKAANKNCAHELSKILTVQAVPNSNLISISVVGPSRYDAAEIANAVAIAAIGAAVEDRSSDLKEQIQRVDREMRRPRELLKVYSKELQRICNQRRALEKEILVAKAVALVNAQVRAKIDYEATAKKLQVIKKESASALANLPEFEKLLKANSQYVSLKKSRFDLSYKIDTAESEAASKQLKTQHSEIQDKIEKVKLSIIFPAKLKERIKLSILADIKKEGVGAIGREIENVNGMLFQQKAWECRIEKEKAKIRPFERAISDLEKKQLELRLKFRSTPPLELFTRAHVPYVD